MGNLCSGSKQAKKEAAEDNMIYEKKPKDESAPSDQPPEGATAEAGKEGEGNADDSPTKSIAEKNAETRESWMAGAQKLIDESATREIQAKSQKIHESLAQKAKQAEQDLAEAGEEVKDEVAEAGEKVKDDVVAKVEEVKDDVTQNVKETIEKVKTEVTTKGEEIQASIGGFVKGVTDQGKAAAAETAVAVEDVKVGIEEEAAKTKDKAESVAETVTTKVSEKVDDVQAAAAAGVEKVESKVDEVSTQVAYKAEEVKKEGEELKTSVQSSIAQQTEKAETRVTELTESAEEKMKNVAAEVESKKEEVVAGVAAAKTEIESSVDQQKENLQNVISEASQKVEHTKEEITSTTQDMKDKAEQSVKNVIEDVGSEVDAKSQVIESSVDRISDEVNQAGKAVGEAATQKAENVKTATQEIVESGEKKINENISAAEENLASAASEIKEKASESFPVPPPPYSGDEYKFDQIIEDLDKSKPTSAELAEELSNIATPVSIDRQNSELENVQREQIEVKKKSEFKVSAEDFMKDLPSELPPPPPPPPEYNQEDPIVKDFVSDLIETAKSAVTTSDFLGSSVDAEPSSENLPAPSSDLMDFTEKSGEPSTQQEKKGNENQTRAEDNMIEHIASQVTSQVVEEAMKIVAADSGNNPGSDQSEQDMSGSMSSTSPTGSLQSPANEKAPLAESNLSDAEKIQQMADGDSGSEVDPPGLLVNSVEGKESSSLPVNPSVNGSADPSSETVAKLSEQETAASSSVDVQKEAII